jgi:kinetochore protein Nuf2
VWSQLSAEQRKNRTLTDDLSSLREETKRENARVTELESECKELEGAINALNYEQAAIRDETAELKSCSAQLKTEIEEGYLRIEEREEERRRLQGQIVKSPERMKRELRDITNTLRSEESDIRQLAASSSHLNGCLENVKLAEREVQQAFDSLGELNTEINKQQQSIEEREQLRQTIAEFETTLEENQDSRQNLQRMCKRLEEKIGKCDSVYGNRQEKAAASISEAEDMLLDLQRLLQAKEEEKLREEAELSRRKKEAEEEEARALQERQRLIGRYRAIERQIFDHLSQVGQLIR